MIYDAEGDALFPEKGPDLPKKLVDLNVVKKGPHYTSKAQKENVLKEEAFLRAEEDRLGKAAKEIERVKKIEEAKKKDEKE